MKKIEHRTINGIECKWCNTCKQWKPLNEFSKDSSKWDGLVSKCKECDNQHNKQYRAEHRDERLEYMRQYDVDHREEKKQYNKQYNAEHRDEMVEYNKQRYQTLKGFCACKYRGHLSEDIKRGRVLDRDHIPTDYITPQFLMKLYQQLDYYDGKLYDWSLMSADRVDNSKPHTVDNVIPATWEHNRDRGYKRMSVEEYKEYIQTKKEELELVL